MALSLFFLSHSVLLFENLFQRFLPFEASSLRETWEGKSPSTQLNPVSLAQMALNTDS